ncbi:MAG: right-handed parallel beta-helix repeat-containing protein [Planctomycetes bacterium]|nr:right-handed parallel beta-helix repeat-containing protein [Planctomycetota bacterium]
MIRQIRMLAVVLGTVSVAGAATLRVPAEYPTIQAAMTAAALSGDTVLVADGTYTGVGNTNLLFNMKSLIVRSENGPAQCIIDCAGLGSGFTFFGEPPTSVVDGFTIINGGGSPGPGIYMYYNSNPSISNCIIRGNTSGQEGGGGIYCALANPTITNCTITGNWGAAGGGVYLMMSSPTIRNCVIAGNTAGALGGGIYCDTGSTPTIVNTILWGNGAQEIFVEIAGAAGVSYSNIQGGWPGAGNINAAPLFADPANGDWRLAPGSPAIDAGDNTALPAHVTTDLDGNPRFVDDPATADCPQAPGSCGIAPIVDMGASEFQVETCPWDCGGGDGGGDGAVGIGDFLALLAQWGGPGACDFDGGGVGIADFLAMLGNWGPCP